MPDLKRVILSVSTLLFLSQNTTLASEYPAPPGHYGQDRILQNSTFNTGKGSPYISIVPAGESRPDKKQETFQANTDNSAIKPGGNPAQTVNYAIQPAVSAQQTPPAADPEPIPVPIAAQPVYSAAPQTAPSRFQEQIYPDADDLSHHYKQSRKLPFGQWGDELPETQPKTLQAPRYGYPGSQQLNTGGYQAAPMEPSFQGSPDLANEMFNPQANQARAHRMPRRNNNSFFNPGSSPVDMMDQFWGGNRNSGFMPPINNQLKTFDQFPVPQNLYGPSPMIQSVHSGNRQYFRQIPKEEIIYPPHYPGNR